MLCQKMKNAILQRMSGSIAKMLIGLDLPNQNLPDIDHGKFSKFGHFVDYSEAT